MTDKEITILCAQAMGYALPNDEWASHAPPYYDPFTDDAQAMALVKKMELHIEPPSWGIKWFVIGEDGTATNDDLNRAICEYVANAQKAKA